MQPYRVIVHKTRRSYSLSTKSYGLNTLTCQFIGTNDTLRDPLHGPVIGSRGDHIGTYSTIFVIVTTNILIT